MMTGPAIEFNRPGIERQLPAYVAMLEKRGNHARRSCTGARPGALLPRTEEERAPDVAARHLHGSPRSSTSASATIQVRHHDRAVTPGDTFLYLPAEKIVITGDLLVNPIIVRAEQLSDRLAADAGEDRRARRRRPRPGARRAAPRQDPVARDMNVMRELLKAGKEAKARGLDPDQARDEVLPRLKDLMVPITKDDPKVNKQFRTLAGRLVYAPRLRRAERPAHRRNRRDPAGERS